MSNEKMLKGWHPLTRNESQILEKKLDTLMGIKSAKSFINTHKLWSNYGKQKRVYCFPMQIDRWFSENIWKNEPTIQIQSAGILVCQIYGINRIKLSLELLYLIKEQLLKRLTLSEKLSQKFLFGRDLSLSNSLLSKNLKEKDTLAIFNPDELPIGWGIIQDIKQVSFKLKNVQDCGFYLRSE